MFEIEFPIWIIAHRDREAKGLLQVTHEEAAGMVGFPIFTDDDLAQTFLDGALLGDHYVLKSIAEPLAAYGLVAILELQGFTHVVLDSSSHQDKSRKTARSPLSEMRAGLLAMLE